MGRAVGLSFVREMFMIAACIPLIPPKAKHSPPAR